MKLRISDNSIRIRVSKVEAEKLMQFETIQMTTGFPADTQLSCQLIPSKVDDLGCTFSSNSISIFIPESMIEAWKSSGTAELETTLHLENGQELLILVEKDFKRLSNRAKEDESDLFINPRKK